MTFIKGMTVIIYQDPLTQLKREGKAKLIRQERPDVGDGLEMWIVRFEDEPGETYPRTISNRPAQAEATAAH